MRTSRAAQDAAKLAALWSPRRTRSAQASTPASSTPPPPPAAKRASSKLAAPTARTTTGARKKHDKANARGAPAANGAGQDGRDSAADVRDEAGDESGNDSSGSSYAGSSYADGPHSGSPYAGSRDMEDAGTPGALKRKRGSNSTGKSLTEPVAAAAAARRSPRYARSVKREPGSGTKPEPRSDEEEEEEEEEEEDSRLSVRTSTSAAALSHSLPRKAKPQPARQSISASGSVTIHPPPAWELQYSTCQRMRARLLAPVDTMGCESQASPHASAVDRRFQTLVALMLSSQTKDTVTAATMARLHAELAPPGLAVGTILALDPAVLNEIIGKVGFHNNKTRYIQAAAKICRDEYGGDIPGTPEGLMGLPGVGPKMAYLCMSAAWGEDLGIGVDVHVHRITNLWGWHTTKNPEETRVLLQQWLPREKWHEINHLLVGLGQTVCAPVGRRCGECDLGQAGICPGAVPQKGRRSVMGMGVRREGGGGVKGEVKKEEVVKREELVKKEEVVKRETEVEIKVEEEEALETK